MQQKGSTFIPATDYKLKQKRISRILSHHVQKRQLHSGGWCKWATAPVQIISFPESPATSAYYIRRRLRARTPLVGELGRKTIAVGKKRKEEDKKRIECERERKEGPKRRPLAVRATKKQATKEVGPESSSGEHPISESAAVELTAGVPPRFAHNGLPPWSSHWLAQHIHVPKGKRKKDETHSRYASRPSCHFGVLLLSCHVESTESRREKQERTDRCCSLRSLRNTVEPNKEPRRMGSVCCSSAAVFSRASKSSRISAFLKAYPPFPRASSFLDCCV